MLSRILIFVFIVMTTSTFAQIPPIESGVPQTLAKWRVANYNDVRYKLNLTLEKMSPTLKGTIEVRVNVRQAGKIMKRAGEVGSSFQILDYQPTIVLDWRKIRGKENLSTISEVSVNGRRVVLNADFSKFNFVVEGREEQNFFETNEHLVFQDGVKLGENVIKLDFTSPIATSGAAITRYVDKEDGAEYVYSLFVPSDASTTFPVFDQPDLKARFQLDIKFPISWNAVSNTLLDTAVIPKCENIAKCFKSYLFKETQPISTYVFAFAAGDFVEFDDKVAKEEHGLDETYMVDDPDVPKDKKTPIKKFITPRIYVRKSQAEKFKQHSAEVFRLNREGVKFLESYFDYKFPFPKYDLVLIPEFPFGGMEHAGATFLREDRIIFPTEPTKNDYITRANVIFHEAAHQWFGDTVTMKWFDDLWLKEGFAEFMAYKTLEKVMPEYNAWKIFYERNKQAAYLTDSTRGTTPIYQEIPNLSAAKSAYGNIVYRKAPSFLRQAEFYLGADKFQTAVRQFLKKHEFANAEWTDLVKEFELASKQDLKDWANVWVTERGLPIFRTMEVPPYKTIWGKKHYTGDYLLIQKPSLENSAFWKEKTKVLIIYKDDSKQVQDLTVSRTFDGFKLLDGKKVQISDGKVVQIIEGKVNLKSLLGMENKASFIFPNYQDYGYGIFLLDDKSRAYVLANIQTEKDDFLRTMMWGALWDSVRETELAPADYVELALKNLRPVSPLETQISTVPLDQWNKWNKGETDETTVQAILARVSTAMNYYLSDKQREEIAPRLEKVLVRGMSGAETIGQQIVYFRAFVNTASTEESERELIWLLTGGTKIKNLNLKTKDKFDIVTRLLILGNKAAPKLLAELEKTETNDEAKRYAYAARAGIGTVESKQKFFDDFLNNKEISESYIESAFVPFNSSRHADLTLPFLEKALVELPNLKRNRKIFFVNGWLSAFIGGQKSERALEIVNKFLIDNPNLDRDLRLKVLEVTDNLERAVKIRAKYK